jgi:transcription factor E
MQINLLKSITEEIAGENSGQMVEILFDKKDVNEFLIAKKMNLTINQIRNVLYKLSAEGLVSFIRKKDKRKGWYIYFWTLNTEKCLIRLQQDLTKKIHELKELLAKREKDRYYVCNSCNVEVSEERALDQDFSCDECAEVYTLVDNANAIRDIKGKITKKEKDLAEIESELEINRAKKAKKTVKEEKKSKKQVKKPKKSKKAVKKSGKVKKKVKSSKKKK